MTGPALTLPVPAVKPASEPPTATELRTLVDSLARTSSSFRVPPAVGSLYAQCNDLRRIRHLLVESTTPRLRDAFRHAHGFETLLSTLHSISGYYRPEKLSTDEKYDCFELLNASLTVLSEALNEHIGNRRYFARRVEDDGWRALEQALASTGIGSGGLSDGDPGLQQLFGCLLSFALGEEGMARVFRDIEKFAVLHHPYQAYSDDSSFPNTPTASSPEVTKANAPQRELLRALHDHVKTFFSGTEVLRNPEIIPIIVNFWAALAGNDPQARARCLSISVPLALKEVVGMSHRNTTACHKTGVLSTLLPMLFDNTRSPDHVFVLRELSDILITFGVNKLTDANYLFREAASSDAAADFLLRGIRMSRGPPFVQFDLTLHGYSSVEVSDLGRTFPPPHPSAGYTMTAWMRIDKFDPNCHTTIFGAYDASQTCFVLAYLEKDTHQFILQTSITGSKPSIRFKTTVFKEGIWYHVAIVHRRPKTTSSSRAALFVDGEFVEQVRCHYPASPSLNNGSTESFASLSSSSHKYPAVQAFLGTPQDLASRLGRNVVVSRWSLASFHLFHDALSDELIAVHQKLGPRYYGNFQDCLGSFQTYRASTELNMYNELLHPGKEEKSDIVTAIRLKASALLPEARILLSISPNAVLDNEDSNSMEESEPIKSLSKSAVKSLQHYIKAGGNAMIINAAVPSINDALTQARGVALLTGEPVVAVFLPLDDASWRIAGCAAICLKLIELAQNKGAVIRAVDILFASIEENWRNSEAMEKQNGFGVLAVLMREKLGFEPSLGKQLHIQSADGSLLANDQDQDLAFTLLKRTLAFVGYNKDHPEDSLIINPLAYRTLLVDHDTWRKSSVQTQKLYYAQFVLFSNGNKYQGFNEKRLNRMRVVKRLIDALKGETISIEVYPDFLQALKVLIKANVTGETLKALALFVTYALQDSRVSGKQIMSGRGMNKRWKSAVVQRASDMPAVTPRSGSPRYDIDSSGVLPLEELGFKTLEVYTELLCDPTNYSMLERFARTITNKWLLHLLAENELRVILMTMKILARTLVVIGSSYAKKFLEKDGGFIILKQRLRELWHSPPIWLVCFAILFGIDVSKINLDQEFNITNLVKTFPYQEIKIAHPDMLPVLAAMLETGLQTLVETQGHAKSADGNEQNPSGLADVLGTLILYLNNLQTKSEHFRDFAACSNYLHELLCVLYRVLLHGSVSAETELRSRKQTTMLTNINTQPRTLSRSSSGRASDIRTTTVNLPPSPTARKPMPLRRGTSFVLVATTNSKRMLLIAQIDHILAPQGIDCPMLEFKDPLVQSFLKVIVAIFLDQIFQRKDFSGFGLFLKVPPGPEGHQASYHSFVLLNALLAISKQTQLYKKLLHEPRVLTNLARYTQHMAEAVFEGWFMNGSEPLLDFIGTLLDYLNRPDVAAIKSVRLCVQAITTIRLVFQRVALVHLSELDDIEKEQESESFLTKLTYWQTIMLPLRSAEDHLLQIICYLTYIKLISPRQTVRVAAINFWRMLLRQRPLDISRILKSVSKANHEHLLPGWVKLIELDDGSFLEWIDCNRTELDDLFLKAMSKAWGEFTAEENSRIRDTAKHRIEKRIERLRQWQTDDTKFENIWHRHEISTVHWRANVHSSERSRHQRAMQDQQDNMNYTATSMVKLNKTLRGPCQMFEKIGPLKWQLDATEGRNRMRMRIIPDSIPVQEEYQPKRKNSARSIRAKLKVDTTVRAAPSKDAIAATPATSLTVDGQALSHSFNSGRDRSSSSISTEQAAAEEEYEIVDDPKEDEDGFEDKNRKVMRSLQRGDQVEDVCNIARIVGLEACEGLLILGRDSLYLIDNYFQRADREIVGAWQAPIEERDPYVQMISGRQTNTRKPWPSPGQQTTRHWPWKDVASISKRRFLFRDVALEIFFTDGRSYLLTAISPQVRNELYGKLTARAPYVNSSSSALNAEHTWRLESLRNPDEVPQSLGSRFANAFNSMSSNPATKKWVRGEISNFHYLMLINTMAGRTFNDLTQYPVFPWVLADYTSEELDLTDPRTFRDLSKPMGCQTPSREAEFRERYQSFAEMGDHTTRPFHYGTHYSSAMIVTSYLIRLQPFVHSYLLLQGGSFDHADRLFYSIEKAWLSASRDNMSDVRELTPEFFYLPECLTNINGYNFGLKQGTGEKIEDVILPRWAKGDPHIFIAKHREALESPHVSNNLHHWIDLVFGYKQRGEAAIEATNMFHHLSYHGAKDLDTIEDPMERLATIGIIHNFGQTPHQVFQRAHTQREHTTQKLRRLDSCAESLVRSPLPLLESNECIVSLLYLPKQERLLYAAPFRLNIPPTYEKYMEWGFADGSVRFYASDNERLIGLSEHLHQGQISCATFVDGKTLITAGTDCTIAVWNVATTSKSVDLQDPRMCLFGHVSPVTVLAASKTLSTFLSASRDGKVFLWDLNRSEYLRELVHGKRSVQSARINDITGNIAICSGRRLLLYTLNGHLLLDQNVCDKDDSDDAITSCAFYEGIGDEWIERELLLTGHRRGIVNVWHKIPGAYGRWTLRLVKRLEQHVSTFKTNIHTAAAITCILPMPQIVYTGDADGRVYEWDCRKQG